MSGSTDWLSAIGILLSGLVLGFMFIYSFRRKSGTAVVDQRRLDLEAKRDTLIEQLRGPDVTAEEKARLEIETANVLRELDTKPAKSATQLLSNSATQHATPAAKRAQAAHAAPTKPALSPAVKGFAWGVISVAAIAGLGIYVYSTAKPKNAPQEQAQAAPMTAPQQQQPGAAQAPDPAVQHLEQAVSADPENVDKRITLARAYLDKENMMGVFEQTNAVLAKNPEEPRAQTYNAIVRMAMGQLDEATKMLESATRHDPKNADSWVALAWVRSQKGDKPAAKQAIDAAITNLPADADRLRNVWTQMENAPIAQPASSGVNPHANGGAMPAAMPGAAPATAAGPDAIHLTLSLDKAAAARTGVVYIIARAEGQTGGPPVAVKRLNVTSFPITVDLSSADSMMGQPLPSTVHIEARLDTDGDAATKSPNDPTAVFDRATAGATIALTLK
jgi:cytochrome c-type biogenesis protein CcmH/NrfG